jgi:hypothetical protein
MDSLTKELWTIGLSGMGVPLGESLEMPAMGLESPAIGNSDSIGTPNRSTFNAMHHLDNGGVVLSTSDHDIGDRITESRSR